MRVRSVTQSASRLVSRNDTGSIDPVPDPTLEKNPDPDPTLEKKTNLNPDLTVKLVRIQTTIKPGSGPDS